MKNNEQITLENSKKDNTISIKDFQPGYNSGNGGGNMDDKYVTHQELELNNEKILHQMDNRFNDVDKRFNEIDKYLIKLDTRMDSTEKTLNWLIGGVILSIIVQFVIKYLL